MKWIKNSFELVSPCKNGRLESSNGKLRDELLNWELFDILAEAKVVIGICRKHYNITITEKRATKMTWHSMSDILVGQSVRVHTFQNFMSKSLLPNFRTT
jgi:hypothetical protein